MTTPSTAVVGRRLTREQAEEAVIQGQLVKSDPHWAWNEDAQKFMPLGQQVAIERFHRENDPEWQLQQYKAKRDALMKFIASELKEAEYDERGLPIAGKLHDYYMLPGYNSRAMTKSGASKTADLFRLRVGKRRVTHSVEDREYVSARVAVELVDGFGQVVGAYEGAASSAEKGFQGKGAQRKYGAQFSGEKCTKEPDFRAALHDIVSRAGKRAFVGAVIVAVSGEELFDIAASTRPDGGEEDDAAIPRQQNVKNKPDPARPAPRAAVPGGLTMMPIGPRKGEPITALEDKELASAAGWCRDKGEKLVAGVKATDLADRFDEVLEERRLAREGRQAQSVDDMPAILDQADDDLPIAS